jgi:hypothetical protein
MVNEVVLAEIDSVLAEYDAVERKYTRQCKGPMGTSSNYLAAPDLAVAKLLTLLREAIYRLSPPSASYISLADKVRIGEPRTAIGLFAGILQALRADFAADRIKTFRELVHSGLFADMLDAADYLLGESYKDPAAVMAGGVLEQHIRELCRKHGIDSTSVNSKGVTKPKMLDALNSDLAKASAYNKIEQKDVTAWAGLRNAAAHARYGDYDANQVKQMIAGIRAFISRHPA